MKSELRAPLFSALVAVSSLAACIAEKKVESGIQATDTSAVTTTSAISAASSTRSTDIAANPESEAPSIQFDQEFDVQLVDTTETEEYTAYKVEVTLGQRVDTIPGVLTFDLPVATRDSLLHGPIYTMEGDYAGIYDYNPRTRVLTRTVLPPDGARWDSEVKLSPDASHIAYIGADSTGSQGIVRSWPAGSVVLTTMKAPQAPSDYSFNQVWWVNRDSVEFLWHTDLGPDTKAPDPRFPFLAIYASVRGKRFTVDTLAEAPNFRAAAER